jgi:hypothetical protein
MVLSAHTTCAMCGSDVGEWNVQTCGQTYWCKDFEWSCSCIFNCSYQTTMHAFDVRSRACSPIRVHIFVVIP